MCRFSHALSRREFMSIAAASAAALTAHCQWAAVVAEPTPGTEAVGRSNPIIVSLRLQTAAALAAMKEFYHDRLGLPVEARSEREITFRAGETPITFVQVESAEEQPWYHVAFNIPENKILAARDWQLQRSKLLQVRAEIAGTDTPIDVADFAHWNAHSIFFWDPAGNLMEYIARHDLKNSAASAFATKDILYASEIGFVTEDTKRVAREIRAATGLGPYRSPESVFLGGDFGLLLVLEKGRRPWALYNEVARGFDVFRTQAVVRGVAKGTRKLAELPYEITVV